jgi:2-alkyl-3-oxoalkanoate reductase
MYQKILITGASGFVGGRLLKDFTRRFPTAQVIGTGRRKERQAEFAALGCQFVPGDLEKIADCERLMEGVDLLIHCAGLSSPWGSYQQFYNANVKPTQQLLEAGKAGNLQRLVLISTPSVYFNFKDRYQVKESDPLPDPMVNQYAYTKLEAEKMVLAANGPDLKTIAIRPRAIIGAEDTVIFPRVLRAYHEGKLQIIGNGQNKVDLTCVTNVIEAVACCIKAEGEALGKPYNISDGEPVSLWGTINELLQSLGLEPVKKKVPLALAMGIAGLNERFNRWFRPDQEPALVRYSIGILARNFSMDISQARNLLGYQPVQSTQQGVEEFVKWYRGQLKS